MQERLTTVYSLLEGAAFRDGTLTARYSSGAPAANGTAEEGNRYRWLGGEEASGVRTQRIEGDAYMAVTARYAGTGATLYGNGEAVAVSRSAGANTRGGTAYLGKDVLGSVRSSTSEYGALEERYEYDAFGKPYKGDFGSGMNLGYTGKPYDTVTGLYNYGYRDYQPETARFTTVDPVRDGSNWFAYVNNDPVNWVDPWGLTASDKGFWGTVGDIAGKIVAAPMTAVGLVAGTVVTGISIISGNGGRVSIENNAVTFTTGLNFGGSITLGNTIIHAGGDVNGWNSQTTTGRYDGAGDVNLGKHEEAHTYQYQTFGVLTPAIIVGSAIVNGGLGESNFHDFMAKSAFETAADNYSEIQREQNK